MATLSVLKLETLGGISLTLNGAPLTGLASRKADALLIYLACRPQLHARDVLADVLWSDITTERARGNLSVLLTSLRQRLGEHLIINRQQVGIDPASGYWLDVAAFEQACQPTQNPIDPDQLSAGLALYRGDFLQGFTLRDSPNFEEWVVAEQERLRRIADEARLRLGEHLLAAGQFAAALDPLTALMQSDPLHEIGQQLLMTLLARTGQRSAALTQYDTYRQRLAKEMGTEPIEATAALYQRIRSGEFEPTPRLNLQRVVQTGVPSLCNAPYQATSFIGRETELNHVLQRLLSPECRLLTVLGSGGMGKTRLAIEAAQRYTAQAGQDAVFVPLAALTDVAAVPTAIGDALDIVLPGKRPLGDEIASYLQDKQVLLLLDNAEQLAGSALAELIQTLLGVAGAVKLFITSREALHLQSEWLFDLRGLDYPADDAAMVSQWVGPHAVERFSALRLFEERAQRTLAGFHLDERNTPAALRICQLVEGLPLGIELAVALLRTASVAEVAEEIAQSYETLTMDQRAYDVPLRHRSLRAVFEHSWHLLSDAGRTLLSRLALCRGGFDLDAALAVSAHARLRLRSGLVELTDKSLLRLVEAERMADDKGEGEQSATVTRYTMHELVRQFALEQLFTDPTIAAQTHARHAAHYLSLFHTYAPGLCGAQPHHAAKRLHADLDNLRQAWYWACANVTDESRAWLNGALIGFVEFYEYAGLQREGEAALAEAVRALASHSEITLPDEIWLRFLAEHLRFLNNLSQYPRTVEWAQRLGATLDDMTFAQPYEAIATMAVRVAMACRWGEAIFYLGDFARARTKVTQAREAARANRLPILEFECLRRLTVITSAQGDSDTMHDCCLAELQLARQMGDRRREGSALNDLSNQNRDRGDYLSAQMYLQQALTIAREIGDRTNEDRSTGNLGTLAWELGDYDRCIALYEQSLKLSREIGNRRGEGVTAGNLGLAYLYQGDYAQARQCLERALAVRQSINEPRGESFVLAFMGLLWHHLGNNALARTHCEHALRIAQQIGARDLQAHAQTYLGHALMELQLWQEAMEAYVDAVAIRRSGGEMSLTVESLAGAASAKQTLGHVAEAHVDLEEILNYIADTPGLNGSEEPFRVYWQCYCLLQAQGDSRANALLMQARGLLQERAARIGNADLRRMFLQEVTAHRLIMHSARVTV